MSDISDTMILTMNKAILGSVAEEPTVKILSLENLEENCYNWLKELPDMMWGRFPAFNEQDDKKNAAWLARQIEKLYEHVAKS